MYQDLAGIDGRSRLIIPPFHLLVRRTGSAPPSLPCDEAIERQVVVGERSSPFQRNRYSRESTGGREEREEERQARAKLDLNAHTPSARGRADHSRG